MDRVRGKRKTGIDLLGEIPWGTHLCQFYQSREDLIDILVPYFKAGLENNEFCIWIVSGPLSKEEALVALKESVPDFQKYIERRQIEIITHTEWYLKGGVFNSPDVFGDWIKKLDQALSEGYEGMRVSGNRAWLEKKDRESFSDHEEEINSLNKYRIIFLCTYQLDKCGAPEVIEVVSHHQFALIRREGKRQFIETSVHKKAVEELRGERDRLETRVQEWPTKLTKAIKALQTEITGRRRVERERKTILQNLGKRVKELTALHRTASILHYEFKPTSELLQEIVLILPSAYQYPEITVARINFDGKEFKSQNFSETPWKQSAYFKTADGKKGFIEIFYSEEKPKEVEGPFLVEERSLINSVAEMLRSYFNRVQTKEILQLERNRFKDILDTMDDGIYIVNQMYDIEYVNPVIEREIGPVQGRKCYEYFNNLKEICPWCRSQEVFTGNPAKWEWYSFKTRKIYDVFNTPMINEDGSVSKFGLLHDITERKQAEERLQRSEERYRNLVENAIDVIFTLSIDGKITSLNPAFETITGWSRTEWLGKDFSPLIHPDDLSLALQNFKRALSGEIPPTCELRVLSKSGEYVIGEFITAPQVENGRVINLLGVARNITERKETEKRIDATNAVLELFTKKFSRKEYLDSVVELIRTWSGCRCVGVRILDKYGNIPYESYVGFSKDFWDSENWLSIKEHQCACIRVVLEKPDPQDFPAMTSFGSFCSNNTLRFLSGLSKEEESRFRGVCMRSGFMSVAIIPIRYHEKALGSLHLADEREGMVPLRKVEFLESIAPLIGEAIYRFSAEAELTRYYHRLEELVDERTAELKKVNEQLLQEITERKKMEEELCMARYELEMRVKERTAELEKANEVLQTEIIERNRAEATIEDLKRRIELILQSAGEGIFGLDQEGKHTFVNRAASEMLGCEDRDLLGQPGHSIWHHSKPDGNPYPEEECPIYSTYKNGAIFIRDDEVFWRKDGTCFPVRYTCTPIRDGEKIIGAVVSFRDISKRKKAEEELKKSHEQLRNLSEHLQSIREEERTNVAREIHDELGQVLTVLKMDLSWLANKLYPDHKPLLEKIESMSKTVNSTIKIVKRICAELRPGILDDLGLIPAIEWQVEEFQNRSGIKCDVSINPKSIIVDKELSTAIFRIFQETLTNVMRHANATEVRVSFEKKNGNLILEVKDNGKGITEDQILDSSKSFGLIGIRERAHFWGGDVKIDGIPNRGTTITVRIPLSRK
ncbi:MAG: PAS domain S-box protein [Nitrospirota bacterium]